MTLSPFANPIFNAFFRAFLAAMWVAITTGFPLLAEGASTRSIIVAAAGAAIGVITARGGLEGLLDGANRQQRTADKAKVEDRRLTAGRKGTA